MGGAQRGVESIGVEVAALRAGVVEHSVQQHAHTQPARLPAKKFEIFFIPQHGVNPGIVRRVITVVGGGFKDRAEV